MQTEYMIVGTEVIVSGVPFIEAIRELEPGDSFKEADLGHCDFQYRKNRSSVERDVHALRKAKYFRGYANVVLTEAGRQAFDDAFESYLL